MAIRRPRQRSPPHVHARQQLADLAERLRFEGADRLPGERQLAISLGVSQNTVKKAIRQLVLEDRLATMPRGGHFILGRRPTIDIGLVVGEGNASTFIREPESLAAILASIHRCGCTPRLLQVRDPADAPDLLDQYRLHGCIWYMPHPTRLKQLDQLIAESRQPMAIICEDPLPAGMPTPNHFFSYDFFGIGRLRAEWLLARGHRRILYCGDDRSPIFEGHVAALAGAGIAMERSLILVDLESITERMPRLLSTETPTAIISHGGKARLDRLYDLLESHPWNDYGDLLVDDIGPAHAELVSRHPRLRIAAINHRPVEAPGQRAVSSLHAAIVRGEPVCSHACLSRIIPAAPSVMLPGGGMEPALAQQPRRSPDPEREVDPSP